MLPDLEHDDDVKAPARNLMPPYLVVRDFLEEDTVERLLKFTLAHERAFEPTTVGRVEGGVINPALRVSVGIRELGEFRPVLKSKILPLVPELVAKLRTTPIAVPKLELHLVAHNDRAFYTRHTDTRTASDQYSIRVLSAVYYFHAEPKAFTGGALRLFAIGGGDDNYADIEPAHNSLLVFPSWAPHEVMPVSCPSKRFIDSRFSISCWIRREEADAAR